jgi:hypothetical protein
MSRPGAKCLSVISVSVALIATGCRSYAVGYRVESAVDRAGTVVAARPSDLDRAVSVVDALGGRFSMTRIVAPNDKEPVVFADGSRLLVMWRREQRPTSQLEAADVYLSASVNASGSELTFVIHDLASRSRSKAIETLDQALREELAAAFPGRNLERREGEQGPEAFAR